MYIIYICICVYIYMYACVCLYIYVYAYRTHITYNYRATSPLKIRTALFFSKHHGLISKAMVGSGVCLVLVEYNADMAESDLVILLAIP